MGKAMTHNCEGGVGARLRTAAVVGRLWNRWRVDGARRMIVG